MERVAAQMTSLLHMKGIFVKEQSVKNTYLWSTLLVANNSLMYSIHYTRAGNLGHFIGSSHANC